MKAIKVTKEAQINNDVILEVGDRIRIVKESSDITEAGWLSYKAIGGNYGMAFFNTTVQDAYNYMIEILGNPNWYRETEYDYEFLYDDAHFSSEYEALKRYHSNIGIGEINYDNVDDAIRKFITIPKDMN
jgi:hypothetical protein